MGREGSVLLTGKDAVGPVQVKMYGRDAWDGALVASAWRRARYRGTQRTARLGRVEYVEHEGLVTFLAERSGARVPHVITAGLILINTVVSLFAGILPVPGGVGVTEGGISLGLTRAGVPAELALAIALSYRFAVFYLPPLWGYLSFKWLAARRYL
jgi:hypothetical protein